MNFKCIPFLQTKIRLNFSALQSKAKQQQTLDVFCFSTKYGERIDTEETDTKNYHFFLSLSVLLTHIHSKLPSEEEKERINCVLSCIINIILLHYLFTLNYYWRCVCVYFGEYLKAFAWKRNKCTDSFRCFIM